MLNDGGDMTQRGIGRVATDLLDRITLLLCGLGSLAVVAIMMIISVDVIGRSFFDAPLQGVHELVSASIVAVVYSQLAHALKAGSLTQARFASRRLGKINQRYSEVYDAIIHCIGAIPFAAISYLGVDATREAFARETFVGTMGLFTFPVWPIYAILTLGSFLLCLQFLRLSICCLSSGADRTEVELD